MKDPVSGPISVEELKALAELPFGQAEAELRKHDPLWGKPAKDHDEQKPIKWKVFVTQEVTMEAFVTVEAVSEEEAMEIAETMSEGELSWDYNSSDSIVAQHAVPK